MKIPERATIDRRRLLTIGSITGLGLAAAAVTGGVLAETGTPTPTATPRTSPEASPKASPAASPASGTTFTVVMVDLAFQPDTLTVPANTEITIDLKNEGVLAHDFSIEQLSISSGLVNPGKTATVKARIPPGTYEFICTVEGHEAAGMVGTLIAK